MARDAELAIAELTHGNPEKAQEYINRMIETTEKVAVPAKDDCPEKHRKTLRSRMLQVKRMAREHFWSAGLLHHLPQKDGWNYDMQQTRDQKYRNKRERKNQNDELNAAKNKKEEEETLRAYMAQRQAGIDEILTVFKNEGADAAVEVLNKQNHWKAGNEHWERGMALLEKAPNKFAEILAILTRGYFDRDDWWPDRTPHDGLAAFHVVAQKLGVIDDKEWHQLFEKWQRCCHTADGPNPMTRKGVKMMVKGLLEAGEWERAIRYYQYLQEKTDLTRETMMECNALIIRYASSRIERGLSGVETALKGEALPGEVSKEQLIEYWNTQVERLLLKGQAEQSSEAGIELLKCLKDPESVRLWVRLITLWSIRTPHQKKDALLSTYSLEEQIAETRFLIVEGMIKNKIPGAESMPEIKSKETPQATAIHLFKMLIEHGFLREHTSNYLNEEHFPHIRNLLSQYQNEFNTVMEVLEAETKKTGGEKPSAIDAKQWPGIFAVLDQIGALTPGIYAEAKACKFDKTKLAQIGEKYRKLKKDAFSSRPIDARMTNELVAELIYVTYQPANMSLSDVQRLCHMVRDCSNHLSRYKFPEEGYSLDLTGNRKMCIRDGETIKTPVGMSLAARMRKINMRELCKIGQLKMEGIDLMSVIGVLAEHPFATKAFKAWENAKTDDEKYRSLWLLREVFGVYLDDNIEKTLLALFRQHWGKISKSVTGMVRRIKAPGRRLAIKNQIGIEIDNDADDMELAAKVIANAIIKKFRPLAEIRKTINDDLKNFVTDGEDQQPVSNIKLRAVVSKNVASFFAKASAGICTASDTELFHREDHFHINLIDDNREKCVGNVQAYFMTHKGKKYLLLRGINPSTNLLKEVDVKALCEAIISVGKKFADENGLAGVLLSEQGGGYHALSNRGEIASHLVKMYGDREVDIGSFAITSTAHISSVFDMDRRPSGNNPVRPFRGAEYQDHSGASIMA